MMDSPTRFMILFFIIWLLITAIDISNDIGQINSKLEAVRVVVMADETPECLKKGE